MPLSNRTEHLNSPTPTRKLRTHTLSGPDHSTPPTAHTAPSTGAAAPAAARLGWRTAIEQTVTGLGYDLVDVERSPRGLLRVDIDRVPGRHYPSGESEFVTVDDCEVVTRQLQYVLEVENVAYERLEVSSPGLDRPLRNAADYQRFAGLEISLTLKLPFQGRKVWKGVLTAPEALVPEAAAEATPDNEATASASVAGTEGWNLVFKDGKTEQVLAFTLDEVREARLVPVVDFKGRRGRQAAAEPAGEDGGQER